MIVNRLLENAKADFSAIRLRTDRPEAAAFYERIGFKRVPVDTATHRMTLSDHF
jgi:hypothetical protein